MSKLSIQSSLVAFADDQNEKAQPVQKYCDWRSSVIGLAVGEVFSERQVIEPGAAHVIPGPLGVLVEPTEVFDVEPHSTKVGLYQVRARGTGLDFLSQSLAVVDAQYTFAPAADGTCTLRCETVFDLAPADPPEAWVSVAAGPFAGLSRGDRVYVRDSASSHGDAAGVFSSLNGGFWQVVRVAAYNGVPAAQVTLQRLDLAEPVGAQETASPASKLDIQKVPGVPPYVKALLIGVGPSLYLGGLWDVVESAKGWFAIKSASVLPELVGVSFRRAYVAAEYIQTVRIEVDQPAQVEFDSGAGPNDVVVVPAIPGDPKGIGWFEVNGFVTSLSIRNISSERLTALAFCAFPKAV